MSNDPVMDFERYSAMQEDKLRKRPLCRICLNRIQDDYFYNINGFIACPDCISDCKEDNDE